VARNHKTDKKTKAFENSSNLDVNQFTSIVAFIEAFCWKAAGAKQK
jgi:hypothetical protein